MINVLINLFTCVGDGACVFNNVEDEVKGCEIIFEVVSHGF